VTGLVVFRAVRALVVTLSALLWERFPHWAGGATHPGGRR
jgi:hypothetical protein